MIIRNNGDEKMRTEMKHKKNKVIPFFILISAAIIFAVYSYNSSMESKLKKQAHFAVLKSAQDVAKLVEVTLNFNINSILVESDSEQYETQGKSNVVINYDGQDVALNISVPLYHDEKLIGELSGTLDAKTDMKPMLEKNFIGQKLMGFLCDSEGRIIASTEDDFSVNQNIFEYLVDELAVCDDMERSLSKAIEEKTGDTFSLRTQYGEVIGCIANVEGTDLYVLEIVPAKVMFFLLRATILQAYFIAGITFILLVMCLLIVIEKQKKKSAKEMAESLGVIEVLSKEYKSVYLIDTENGHVVPYRLSDDMQRNYKDSMMKSVSWEEGMKGYANNLVKEEYREEFIQKCSLKNLRQQLQKEGDYFYYEFMNDIEGRQHVFRIVASLLPDSKKKQIVLGFADINDEREKELSLQRTLQDACNRAEAANKAKSTFLFNISHDIRTPMNAIIGFTDLAMRFENDTEKLDGYLKKIKSASEYMMKLLNGVLEMARIETGKITLDLAPVDLSQVFNGAISLFEEEAKRKNITYLCDIRFERIVGNIDSIRVQEILANIISNAIKYTCENGWVNVCADVQEKEANQCILQVTVKDNGIGMSREFQKRLFDNFERERNEYTTEIQGTGLGMGITRQLIEIMGGTIQVESESRKGTTVMMQIPFEKVDMARVLLEEEDKDVYAKYYQGKRILLTEDNEFNAEIAMEIIRDAGLEVERAHDGVECISMLLKADEGYYDLILMDIQMPYLDGYMTTKKIRNLENETRANIPIIAMSANAFEEDRKRAFEAGMDGFSPKPIDVKKLLETIAEVFVFR